VVAKAVLPAPGSSEATYSTVIASPYFLTTKGLYRTRLSGGQSLFGSLFKLKTTQAMLVFKLMKTPLYILLVCGLLSVLSAVACSVQKIPSHEIQAQEINKTLMCPVCPGESIDQSQHPLASQMRGVVDEKLEEGWNGEQVRNFFVERYGVRVLLEPPRRGGNLLVWIVPPIGIVMGMLVLYMVLRMMTRPQPEGELRASRVDLTGPERETYFSLVEQALLEDVPPADQSSENSSTEPEE